MSKTITDRDGQPYALTLEEIKHWEYQSETTRRVLLDTLHRYGRGHSGPSLSLIEILTTLYFKELRLDPDDPKWPERDRFILSKGHGALGYYCSLAQRGLIPMEELATFESLGSRLQGHVDSIWLPWVELTTGSLGLGLSVGLGVALGAKRLEKDIRAYVVIGDGESEEGNIWEAAMAAAKFEADNLCCIVDFNSLQGGVTLEVMPSLEPFADKWLAFGWHVIDIPGHDIDALLSAYHEARQTKGKPTVIIARTVKGKGVSYMENKVEWHGGTVTEPLYEQAIAEIDGRLSALQDYAVLN